MILRYMHVVSLFRLKVNFINSYVYLFWTLILIYYDES